MKFLFLGLILKFVIAIVLTGCKKEMITNDVYISNIENGKYTIFLAQNCSFAQDSICFDGNSKFMTTNKLIDKTFSVNGNNSLTFWEVRNDSLFELKPQTYSGQSRYIRSITSGSHDGFLHIKFIVSNRNEYNSPFGAEQMDYISKLNNYADKLKKEGCNPKEYYNPTWR